MGGISVQDIFPWCVIHLFSLGFELEEIMALGADGIIYTSNQFIDWFPLVDPRYN